MYSRAASNRVGWVGSFSPAKGPFVFWGESVEPCRRLIVPDMSEQDSLERQLKKARLQSAYESHQVSATRVASHAIGRSVRMPWEIAENFLGMPSLPSPFEKGGCLIAASSKVPASVEPAKPAPARLETLRLAGVPWGLAGTRNSQRLGKLP